ncbi:unnamed protein product [Sphagnum balticum]
MSNIKDGLLAQIARKVKRKKDLREEIATRNENIEAFALKMINDMEDMIATTANTSLLASLASLYGKSFEQQVKVIDPGSSVDIQWLDSGNGIPRVNGIMIKWSKEYQDKNNCDELLFVDVTSLLFK